MLSDRNVGAVCDSESEALLRVELFGEPRLLDRRGETIVVSSRKALALLAILATNRNQRVPRSKIAGLLWDRVPEQQARKSLRQALADLGAALGPASHAIEATRDSIRLLARDVSTDLEDLSRRDVVDATAYTSTFLAGFDGLTESLGEWLYQERTAKAELVRKWHEDRIADLLEQDAPATARVGAARQLLAFDAAHERAWRVLIRGLAELGDVGQALREYKSCEMALRRFLDAEPSDETKALRTEIGRKAPGGVRIAASATPPQRPIELIGGPGRQASIAVLPLLQLSSESRIPFLANGLLEGIIHVLSGIGDLFVISRGSVVKYAGASVEPRDAGLELGVQYILSGTISGYGRKVSIYLELSESTTGQVLWTERMRINAIDMFAVQEAVASEVVSAIAPSVRANELARARRKPPSSLTAYDLLLQALDKLYTLERKAFDDAGKLFRRSMKLDAGFAAARSHAATWHNFRVGQGWASDPVADSSKAAELSNAALMLDHNDAIALAIQGQVLSFTRRDYDRARTFLDRAVRVGPSCHLAWSLSSATHGWTGDGAKAIEHAERALRISPFDPFAYFAEHMLSQGHYVSRDFDKAIFWARRAADRNSRLTSNLRTLSAALVAAGERQEAQRVVQRLQAIEPNFDLDRFEARTPFRSDIREEHVERLREAGL